MWRRHVRERSGDLGRNTLRGLARCHHGSLQRRGARQTEGQVGTWPYRIPVPLFPAVRVRFRVPHQRRPAGAAAQRFRLRPVYFRRRRLRDRNSGAGHRRPARDPTRIRLLDGSGAFGVRDRQRKRVDGDPGDSVPAASDLEQSCQSSWLPVAAANERRSVIRIKHSHLDLFYRKFHVFMVLLDPETGPQWLRTLFFFLLSFLLFSDFQFPKTLSFLNRS